LYINAQGISKDEVVPVLLTEHHAMEAYWGGEVQLNAFFDLGSRWRRVVSFTPWPFYSQGRAPGTYCIEGWVSPRAVLDAVVKKKIPSTPPQEAYAKKRLYRHTHTCLCVCMTVI